MKKRQWFLALQFWFVLALLAVTPALAVEAAAANVGSLVADTVLPFLSAGVMVGIVWLVMRIGKKYKLDVLVRNEERIEQLARQAIGYVEEKAAVYLKKNRKLNSSEKLNSAVSLVQKHMPEVGSDKAFTVVKSMLARVKGAGATGDKALR